MKERYPHKDSPSFDTNLPCREDDLHSSLFWGNRVDNEDLDIDHELPYFEPDTNLIRFSYIFDKPNMI